MFVERLADERALRANDTALISDRAPSALLRFSSAADEYGRDKTLVIGIKLAKALQFVEPNDASADFFAIDHPTGDLAYRLPPIFGSAMPGSSFMRRADEVREAAN